MHKMGGVAPKGFGSAFLFRPVVWISWQGWEKVPGNDGAGLCGADSAIPKGGPV